MPMEFDQLNFLLIESAGREENPIGNDGLADAVLSAHP